MRLAIVAVASAVIGVNAFASNAIECVVSLSQQIDNNYTVDQRPLLISYDRDTDKNQLIKRVPLTVVGDKSEYQRSLAIAESDAQAISTILFHQAEDGTTTIDNLTNSGGSLGKMNDKAAASAQSAQVKLDGTHFGIITISCLRK